MQGRYKAVAIEEDSYLLHLSRYIHQNPLKINFVLANLKNYPWSSYPTYLGISANSFLHPREIMDYFSKEHSALSYQAFVEATEEITLPEPLELEAD